MSVSLTSASESVYSIMISFILICFITCTKTFVNGQINPLLNINTRFEQYMLELP